MAQTDKGFEFQLEANFLGRILPNMFKEDAKKLDEAFTDSFNKAVWSWPQETKRKNGTTVGSPRDIVDTGATRDSQRMLWQDRYHVSWEWDHPAAIIYDGRRDTDKYPARPFIDEALQSVGSLKYSKISFIGGLGTS